MDALITVKEAARRCSFSPATIYRWAACERIPAVRIGRSVRLRESDVEQLILTGTAIDKVRLRLPVGQRAGQ